MTSGLMGSGHRVTTTLSPFALLKWHARNWLLGSLLFFGSAEVCSLLGLWCLKHMYGLTYEASVAAKISAHSRSVTHLLLSGQTSYIIHSPTLGWTIKPNGHAELWRANAQGLRANREYLLQPSPGIRVAAFGDSFVHANTVSNAEMWTEQLIEFEPDLEVMNFGVSGYGLDQAFLRYQQEGVAFQPNIVLIGLVPRYYVSRHVKYLIRSANPRGNLSKGA